MVLKLLIVLWGHVMLYVMVNYSTRYYQMQLPIAIKHSTSLQGWATLHGLSDYITSKDQQETSYSSSIIQSIAKNEATIETQYQEEEWTNVCIDFIEQGLSKESNLYSSTRGFIFSHIEHHADTSDYSNTCGGSMAVYTFK